MNRLNFEFLPMPHPYRDEPSSKFEMWGRIKLQIANAILIDHEWDVIEIFEWFFNFKKNWASDFPFEIQRDESIAEYRDRLYSKIHFNSESEEYGYFSRLEEYFSNHTFKLRGTDTDFFYVGVLPSKVGEISFKHDEKYFSYTFDMEYFLIDTEVKLIDFVNSWMTKYSTDQAVNRIKDLAKSYSINIVKS